ncbi:hypothetical protein D3C74_484290 [compost metagenome]
MSVPARKTTAITSVDTGTRQRFLCCGGGESVELGVELMISAYEVLGIRKFRKKMVGVPSNA